MGALWISLSNFTQSLIIKHNTKKNLLKNLKKRRFLYELILKAYLFLIIANGETAIDVKIEYEKLRLTQREVADIFGTKVPAINKHIQNIIKGQELDVSTISKMEIVEKEGKRKIRRVVDVEQCVR